MSDVTASCCPCPVGHLCKTLLCLLVSAAQPAASFRVSILHQAVSQRHKEIAFDRQQHCIQVLFVETSSSTGLDSVVASVTTLVGAPHNYTVSDSRPENSQPTDASRPAGALAAVAGGGAVDHATDQAALEVQPAQLTAEEVRQTCHCTHEVIEA